ncbi:MAG: DUF692 domain-containing protein [Gammaproteobacteria bacterium]
MSRISGAGLGLRRALMEDLLEVRPPLTAPDFLEVAPENWIGVGGRLGRRFRALTERYPFLLHGLSLSIGSRDPLDLELVAAVGQFMATHGITTYSEHLSYCSDDGHLYDLMPLPFTSEAVHHVAARIRQVQDLLGMRIAMENVSYYAPLGGELTELQFLSAVLEEADCDLLLDVNNVYVNSINHAYDAGAFISALPSNRIRYLHIAGHYDEAPDLKVDTHGADVIEPVWALLAKTYERHGVRPTLLERDFNLPAFADLLREVSDIREIQGVAALERRPPQGVIA